MAEEPSMRLASHLSFATHALVLCAAGAAAAQVGPIDFKSREAAEGRNYAERITASLAVGKSSGQATYGYSFGLPAGRGVSPSLALSYSSSGGPSEVGTGWALTVPMIERSSTHGVPTFTDADTFQFRDGHSAPELIGTGELTSEGWIVYREQSERSFARYLRKDNSWRILFKDGTRFELGTSLDARRGPDRNQDPGTAAWMLARIADTHGNEALYSYADGEGEQALLRTISYTGNPAIGLAPTYVVSLEWEPLFAATDETITSFRRGYKESFGVERLASVKISAPAIDTTNSPAKVPASSPTNIAHWITHETSTQGITTYRISRIQLADRPELVFSYSDPWPTPSEFKPAQIKLALPQFPPDVMADNLGRSETEDTTGPRTWTRIVLADVTADGRPDLIDAGTECSELDRWIVWRNTESGFVAERWSAPNVPDGATRDRCALRITQNLTTTVATWQELVDFTGDALPDLAYWDKKNMWICRGNGVGFEPCALWGPLPPGVTAGMFRRESTAVSNVSATDVDLVDFNADGFVDRVSTSIASSPPTINVVLNDRGQRWGDLQQYPLPDCAVERTSDRRSHLANGAVIPMRKPTGLQTQRAASIEPARSMMP